MSYDSKQQQPSWSQFPVDVKASTPPPWSPPQQWQPGPPPHQWQPGPPYKSQQGPQQWQQGPPQNWQQGPPQNWQQGSQQQDHQNSWGSTTFHFTGPESGRANSSVQDRAGRTLFSFSSDKKRTEIKDVSGQTIATIVWHSTPDITYRGATMKLKDFVPLNHNKTGRIITWNGVRYEWTMEGQYFYLHASGRRVANWLDQGGNTTIEILPDGMQANVLEPTVLSIFAMSCGRPIGDVKKGSSFINAGGLIGGAIGVFLTM